MSAPERDVILGLAAPTFAALLGTFASLLWNLFNTWWTANTRNSSSKLEYFNAHARQPLLTALSGFEEMIDSADDLIRSSQTLEQRRSDLEKLRPKFHHARRILARRLGDIQKSELIDGHEWIFFVDLVDPAVAALDDAATAQDTDAFSACLRDLITQLEIVRARIRERLDAETEKISRSWRV